MVKHAIAMVKWDRFRSGGSSSGVAVYDYGSDKKILLQRVAEGGTLWLITSRRKASSQTSYHLAYKLVNCKRIDPDKSLFSGEYKFVVRAKDWEKSRHFKFNDATDTLRRLHFSSGKTMSEVTNIGLRLLSIPELTKTDIEMLELLQHKIENGRAVFISYSHQDSTFTSELEFELSTRDISTSRDVTFLKAGQEWEEAIRREVMGTDCFIVIVSPESAKSNEVKKEVQWAIQEYDAHGLIKAIIPVVLSAGGWNMFPELHRFHYWQYPHSDINKEDFDKLTNAIVSGSEGGF